MARGAVGRPGDPGARGVRDPDPAGRRRGPVGVAGRGVVRRAAGAAGRAGRPGVVRAGHRAGGGGRRRRTSWFPLRGLLPHLADQSLSGAPLVFHALGLAEWLFATRFCPRCGGALEPRAAGHELVCSLCERVQFPRTDPAVIMIVTYGEPGSEDERCLLGRQAIWPEGRYSTLAGFCEPGESLEDAVRREVAEEVGVRVGAVEYFGNQPWPLPASLMVGLRRARRVAGHHRRHRRDRGRPLVHPRRDEGRGRGRRRWCFPAASRSAGHWSSTGTAASCPATGELGPAVSCRGTRARRW